MWVLSLISPVSRTGTDTHLIKGGWVDGQTDRWMNGQIDNSTYHLFLFAWYLTFLLVNHILSITPTIFWDIMLLHNNSL